MDALKDVNPYLSELQHLTYLDLSRLYIHPIPEFLGSMQRLRYLSLQGGEGDAIPIPSSSISNLTNLRALYLDDFTFKNLTASTWLAPLSSLQYLNLKDMDLPMNLYKFSHFDNLQILSLRGCGFAGELPSTLQNMTSIRSLDFSQNSLSSIVPLGKLENLVKLNLESKIPERIGDMRSLESIDLSHNHLSGAIPRNMIDLNLLSHLNLSYNNLSGSIPIENQFQTLNDPLSYTSNQYLSGAPLPKYYPGDGPHHVPTFEGYEDEDRKNDQLEKAFFYSIVSIGFVTGFWGNY
nr:receptor-like protein 50 [Arachis hypogaea]